jgi:hypothetical protein
MTTRGRRSWPVLYAGPLTTRGPGDITLCIAIGRGLTGRSVAMSRDVGHHGAALGDQRNRGRHGDWAGGRHQTTTLLIARREPEGALPATTGVRRHSEGPTNMTEQGQRPDLPARPAGGDAEDDAAVIRRSHDEPEHFAVLFRRYAPGVQRYVRRRLGVSAADDVVAETFLAAFHRRDRYDLE